MISQTDAATHIQHPQFAKILEAPLKFVQQVADLDLKKKLVREAREAGGLLNVVLLVFGKAIKIHFQLGVRNYQLAAGLNNRLEHALNTSIE